MQKKKRVKNDDARPVVIIDKRVAGITSECYQQRK